MRAGGLIREDDPELAARRELVARAICLSPALIAATHTDQIRQLLGEIV